MKDEAQEDVENREISHRQKDRRGLKRVGWFAALMDESFRADLLKEPPPPAHRQSMLTIPQN
jgi:hypothetical protein